MLNKNLVLGSANFTSGYGLRSSKGFTITQLNLISDILKKNNIKFIDTAYSYKGSQSKIGKSNLKKFKIYTKIPKFLYRKKLDIKAWIDKIIKKSLKQTKQKYFSGVYFHNYKDLLSKNGDYFFSALSELKKQGLIKKIGVSVYSPQELNDVINKFQIDIAQIPLNIFDRRFLKNNFLKRIKKLGIEVHARSIFLQGLLLMGPNEVPAYFKKWNKLFKNWNEWNNENKQNKIRTCFNFINSIKYIDKIIIGINSIYELKILIDFYKNSKGKFPKKIYTLDEKLIDPRLWRNLFL